ncbi:Hypothetical predicted protein [Pelobates cultripes]|uniref:Uncharacterized protein n=1 Tax=Pelobates cultripes TaxID=61616 RepID=A0AAD1WDQ5_PELCU|nr:Hypothetical predicted protein [Pelobates cultripes]
MKSGETNTPTLSTITYPHQNTMLENGKPEQSKQDTSKRQTQTHNTCHPHDEYHHTHRTNNKTHPIHRSPAEQDLKGENLG